MTNAEGLAATAALLADRTRASICLALMDGRAWTAGELATHAGVARSTATEHLHMLVRGGLLAEERQGKHRYVRLAGPDVAELVEVLAARAAPAPSARSLRAVTRDRALARARTCYDHLAGSLGVTVTDALTARGLVSQAGGWTVTESGLAWLAGLGVDVVALRQGRRVLARPCLDWTERRPHLAGAAAAALCRHATDAGWIVGIGSGRAVRVTARGERALTELLAVDWPAVA